MDFMGVMLLLNRKNSGGGGALGKSIFPYCELILASYNSTLGYCPDVASVQNGEKIKLVDGMMIWLYVSTAPGTSGQISASAANPYRWKINVGGTGDKDWVNESGNVSSSTYSDTVTSTTKSGTTTSTRYRVFGISTGIHVLIYRGGVWRETQPI